MTNTIVKGGGLMAGKVVSVRLEAKTAGFVAGMRTAKQSVDDLTSTTKSRSQAFNDLSNKAAVAGGAIALGLGVAVKRFAEFDSAMSGVAANSGATGAELGKLRSAALELGADTQFSAKEAADGINELAKAGVSTSDILGGGLKGSLDLAAAGQIGVGEAAEVAASAMTQFNLDGGQVPHIADLMTNAANKAQGGVGDMGQALQQAGLVASATGLSIEETTGGLTAFASAGLTGSDAGTSFKTMLQRLSAPSAEAAGLMDELGINAYDSQGNFVGLANVAGQLEQGMSKLTPAQRNAAMATIFGSDAVRAANILYSEGSAGISKWTREVSESGAASAQAAKLNDNLKGDIERLGGALDSAFIKTGSGANGALRLLVKGLTGVVDGVAKIPGPVLLAGGALSSLALVGPKAVTAFRDYKATLDSLGLSMDKISAKSPRAAGALRAVSGAAKIGAVVGVGIAALNKLDSSLQAATPSARELGDALDTLARNGSMRMFNSEFSQFFNQTSAHKALFGSMGNDINGVGDAIAYLNSKSKPDAFTDWKNGLLGLSNDTDKAEKAIKKTDKAITELFKADPAAGMKAWDGLVRDAKRSGVSVDELKKKFPGMTAAMKEADQAARWAGKGNAAHAAQMEKAEKAADDLKDAITGLGDALLGQRGSARDYHQALADVGSALKENGSTLDITTKAGRDNQAALDGLAEATQEYAAATLESTGSMSKAEGVLSRGRTQFERLATSMGMPKREVKALADQLFKLPANAKSKVEVAGVDDAKRKTTDWKAVLTGVPSKKNTAVSTTGAESSKAKVVALGTTITSLTGKTVKVTEDGAHVSSVNIRELDGSLLGLPSHKKVQVSEVGTTKAGEMVVSFRGELFKIPRSKTVAIRESGSKVGRQNVMSLGSSIKLLNGKKVKVGEDGALNAKGRVVKLDGAVVGLKGKTVRVQEIGSTASGGRVVRFRGEIYELKGKNVKVSETGADQARGRVQDMRGAIELVRSKTVNTNANVRGTGDVRTLSNAIGNVRDKTVTITTVTRKINSWFADGGMYEDGHQSFADGGTFRGQQPRIRAAGGRGVTWAEEGAGPWEAFISGHPAKKARSVAILDQVARRLGRATLPLEQSSLKFASGGVYGDWQKWLRQAQRMSSKYKFEDGSRKIRIFEDGTAQWRGYGAAPAAARKVIAQLNAAQDRYEDGLNAPRRSRGWQGTPGGGRTKAWRHSNEYYAKRRQSASQSTRKAAPKWEHSAEYYRKQREWAKERAAKGSRRWQHSPEYNRKQAEWARERRQQKTKSSRWEHSPEYVIKQRTWARERQKKAAGWKPSKEYTARKQKAWARLELQTAQRKRLQERHRDELKRRSPSKYANKSYGSPSGSSGGSSSGGGGGGTGTLTEAGVQRAMTAAVRQLRVTTTINGRDFHAVIRRTTNDRKGR